jgi:hypothetical protein
MTRFSRFARCRLSRFARYHRPAHVIAAVLIVALGCAGSAGDGDAAGDGVPAAARDRHPEAGLPPGAETGAATGLPSGAGAEPDPAPATDVTNRPGAPAPAGDGPDDPSGTWTAAGSRAERAAAGVATLREVRTAGHDGFDRIVLDFGADPIPSWEVEYIDRPVRQCGSGDAVPVAGDAWLRIHVQPARGHTDAGHATVTDRRRSPRLPVILALVMTCDFEAHVEWVAGVATPNAYRVIELGSPSRLVVDVRHQGRR